MQRMLKRILLKISALGLVFPALAWAQTNYLVTSGTFLGTGPGPVNNSYTPPAITGDLLYVINQINTAGSGGSGTAGAAATNNMVYLNSGIPSITVNQNIPILLNGATFTSNNSGGTSIISGINTNPNINNGNNFNLFATYNASLALSGILLQNGVATGGAGYGLSTGPATGAGGGGGLAAGGGIYIDPDQTLSLSNVTITGCSAIGGPGGFGNQVGSGVGGGGGGASFSVAAVQNNGINGSGQSSGSIGGGDFPGTNYAPDPTIVDYIGSGYGGGNGGTGSPSNGTTSTLGVANGGSAGIGAGILETDPATVIVSPVPVSNSNGGNAGYSGGGGGGGAYGGGGGGGNPGGYGNLYPLLTQTNGGGGGGGYGSGGAGGWQTGGGANTTGGGGGGGFGGGGGGAGTSSGTSAGGGGGGWGGGGGGGGLTAASGGAGGNFGGAGASSAQGGGGGGGAAIGGAIFVGDGATVMVGDGVSIVPGANSVIGGAAGGTGTSTATAGTGYATDIFLFQNASLDFVGTVGYPSTSPFATAIQADNTIPAPIPYTIPPDRGVTINTTLATTPITLTSTLHNYAGGTTIQQGILYIAGTAYLPPTGAVNITTANGTLYLTGDYTPAVSMSNLGGAINVSNGAIFTLPSGSNTFNNTGALYVLGAGSNIIGAIPSGTSLSIGQDSLSPPTISGNNFTASGNITVNSLNIYDSSSFNDGGNTVSANVFVTGLTGPTTGTFTGNNTSGTLLTIGADSLGNSFTNTAFLATSIITPAIFQTINVSNGSFDSNGFAITPNNMNAYNNSQVLSSGGGSITTNLYMTGTSTFSDGGTNTISGPMLTIGEDSTTATYPATAFAAAQPFSTFPIINLNAGTFTTNTFAVSNVNTSFNIATGTSATFDAVVSGIGTLNVNGTGILYNTVTDGIGLTGLITVAGTLNSTQNLTLGNTIDFSGTLNVSTGFTLTSNGPLFVFGNAMLNGAIAGGGGSSLTIGENSSLVTQATNATINSTISGIPTFAVVNGTVTTNGVITGVDTALSISAGATAIFKADISGAVAATNAGTITTYATIDVNSFTNTGLGATNFVITNDTIFGNIAATGAVDLGTSNSVVTSNFIFAVANNTYTWPIVTGASVTPNPANITIPTDTVANRWDITQDANSIVVQLQKLALDATNPIIGPVLNEMSLDPTNVDEFTLIDALGNASSEDQLTQFVNELIPDLNSQALNIMKQDIVFRQVEHRIRSIRTSLATNDAYGISAGDIDYNKVFWIGPFGSIANQQPEDYNFGYRAYSGGLILGVDMLRRERELYGLAFAYSTTNVQGKINPGLNTRINGYHLLVYGSHELGKTFNHFLEWMFNGAINANYGNKRILISGEDLSTSVSYRDQQAGFLVNYGRNFKVNKYCEMTPMAGLQYNFIHSPPYDENALSPAALHVDNGNGNVFTLLAGGESKLIFNTTWFKGTPILSAMLGYDVISSGNTTTANFLIGGSSFTYSTNAPRFSISLGADCTFDLNEQTQFQVLYELQIRRGYVANAGTAKLKFLF